ncbi:MAG TPA: PIG-L family deacetylase [Candidatus Binatia bacterium]|nr:PIG-L family deacetylase [Candidatus Binatia bacterium]
MATRKPAKKRSPKPKSIKPVAKSVPKTKPKALKARPDVTKLTASKTARLEPETVVELKPEPAKKQSTGRKESAAGQSMFSRFYVWLSLLALLGSSIYWALLGARVQLSNSDQLVDSQLFTNLSTFKGATFPGAHSLLLKWPIFWLISLFGNTNAVIEGFTIGLALVTVAALVGVIYLIERRRLVFGTICLALASVLVLVPITPYAGALLPVSMAMLTTRNIEYVVFILSLVLLLHAPSFKSWRFWLAALVLSILIASDKLFMIVTIGGALVALVVYAQAKAWPVVSLVVKWLILGLLASVGAIIILKLVESSGLTHITSVSNSSPYDLSTTMKELGLGCVYLVMGLLTNFGANPAFDATEVKNIPHQIFSRLFSVGGPDYLINFVLLIVGLVAVYKVLVYSFRVRRNSQELPMDRSHLLSVMLIWSSLVAMVSFVVTNHYYAVDARYLTIVLFAVFISLASWARTRDWQPRHLVTAGFVIAIGIVCGLVGATRGYNADIKALAFQNDRNSLVAQLLDRHKVDLLVGDYWRVMPINQIADANVNVMPLSGCTQPQSALSSTVWQPNLHKTPFAYLLSLQGNLTNYPNCSLKQIISAYGHPNASSLIAGSLSNPQELVLFYDSGIHKSSPKPGSTTSTSTVLPIPLSSLPSTSCAGPSVMNIVAHQDDDLLFMNPDIAGDIQAGDCVRTIYLTAGNAGAGEFYWLSREQGVEAAYSYMLGNSTAVWIQRIVELNSHEFITVANPRANTKISLIFMHLPDGNLQGQGFSSSDFESLAKLENGSIKVVNSVDNQSYYTSTQLVNALTSLMAAYTPSGINTQSEFVGSKFPDHSDHLATSWFAKQAYKQYETQQYANQVIIPIMYYEGYPIREQPANVSGAALTEKEAVFMAYAKYDSHVCQTLQSCLQTPTYNGYLARQYTNPY